VAPAGSSTGSGSVAVNWNCGTGAGNGETDAVTAATAIGVVVGPQPVSANTRISKGLAVGFGVSSKVK
jgi:hypothetical protein